MRKIMLGVLMLSAASSASADLGKRVKTVSEWSVYMSTDVMTDENKCVAVYLDNKNIQLTSDSLAFGNLGYAQAYTYRIDDTPLSPLQLNPDVPKRMGAVVLDEPLFSKIYYSKRFRIQITASSLETFDLKTSAIPAVLAEFKAQKCN